MKIFTPNANTALPDLSHVLLVFKPLQVHPLWERLWLGHVLDDSTKVLALPFYKKILLSKSIGQYHRANPRKLEYMLGVTQEYLAQHAPNAEVDLLLEAGCPMPETQHTGLRQIYTTLPHDLQAYSAIFLLYPDAIGLRWSGLEGRLARASSAPIMVINGRRRVFGWDSEAKRALYWRRTLDNFFLFELLLIPALIVGTGILSLYDSLRAKKNGLHNE